MVRSILFVLAALASCACSYGSAVDIAPHKDRAARAITADADYCEVTGQWAPFTVRSSKDCVPVRWNGSARVYAVSLDDGPQDTTDAKITTLGSGLYAAQIDVEDGPAPHQIHLLISSGDAFALLRVLDDGELRAMARRHPRISFAADRGRPYVAAGSIKQVKAYLRDIAGEALRTANAAGELLSVGVADMGGTPDHAASKEQAKDIEAVLRIARKLTPD
ncbi:MAG: hypothetical protein SGJ21_15475 [Alphaproteobacteria bacterium]|nr:hypothetical protein [Alphaproteobacteria bacterium]